MQTVTPGQRSAFRKVSAGRSGADEWVTVSGPQQRGAMRATPMSVFAQSSQPHSSSSQAGFTHVGRPSNSGPPRPSRAAPQGATLFVAGIPAVHSVEEQIKIKEHLRNHLSQWAKVTFVKLVAGRQNESHVKCAFAEFETAADASRVLENANGSHFHGMYLRLERSRGDRTVRFEMSGSKVDLDKLSCRPDGQRLLTDADLADLSALSAGPRLTESLAIKLVRAFGRVDAVDTRFMDLGDGAAVDVVMSSIEEARDAIEVLESVGEAGGLQIGWANFQNLSPVRVNSGSSEPPSSNGPPSTERRAGVFVNVKMPPTDRSSSPSVEPSSTRSSSSSPVSADAARDQLVPTPSSLGAVPMQSVHSIKGSRSGVHPSAAARAPQKKDLEALVADMGISTFAGPWGSSEYNSPTLDGTTPKDGSQSFDMSSSPMTSLGRPRTPGLAHTGSFNEEADSTISSAPVLTPQSERLHGGRFAEPNKARTSGDPSSLAYIPPGDEKLYDLTTIWVGSLPVATTEDEVRQLFSDCGTIQKVKIQRGANPQISYAFVHFFDETSVEHALAKQGMLWKNDKPITVRRKTKVSPGTTAKRRIAGTAAAQGRGRASPAGQEKPDAVGTTSETKTSPQTYRMSESATGSPAKAPGPRSRASPMPRGDSEHVRQPTSPARTLKADLAQGGPPPGVGAAALPMPAMHQAQPYAVTWNGERWLPVLPPMPSMSTASDMVRYMSQSSAQGYITFEQYMAMMASATAHMPPQSSFNNTQDAGAGALHPPPQPQQMPMPYPFYGYPIPPWGMPAYPPPGDPSEWAGRAMQPPGPLDQHVLAGGFNPMLAPFVPGSHPSDMAPAHEMHGHRMSYPPMPPTSMSMHSQTQQPAAPPPGPTHTSPRTTAHTRPQIRTMTSWPQPDPVRAGAHGRAAKFAGQDRNKPPPSAPGPGSNPVPSGLTAPYPQDAQSGTVQSTSAASMGGAGASPQHTMFMPPPPHFDTSNTQSSRGPHDGHGHTSQIRIATLPNVPFFPASFLAPAPTPAQPPPSSTSSEHPTQRIDIPAYMADY